ncbi:MAG: tetratricopeptide repeat protein [Myxococcota bacterium]
MRKWAAAFVLSMTLLGPSACSSDIQSGIQSANDLLYRKQYVESERLYRKLLKRLETRGELTEAQEQHRLLILDRLGKLNALYLHDYNQAITDYGVLVRRYPKTDQALAARATVADIYQHKLGDFSMAIDQFQKLTAEFPDRAETRWAQLQVTQAYFQLKNYDQARTEAEALINRWPNSPEAAQARFKIANSYYVQSRYTEAIATYERLLEGEPDPSLASLVIFELGNCFQELGESERALAYYYACLPDHANPQLVQNKIRRVRARLKHTRPAMSIHMPSYLKSRLASQSTTLTSATHPQPAPVPERRVVKSAPPPMSDGQEGTSSDLDDSHEPVNKAPSLPEKKPEIQVKSDSKPVMKSLTKPSPRATADVSGNLPSEGTSEENAPPVKEAKPKPTPPKPSAPVPEAPEDEELP